MIQLDMISLENCETEEKQYTARSELKTIESAEETVEGTGKQGMW